MEKIFVCGGGWVWREAGGLRGLGKAQKDRHRQKENQENRRRSEAHVEGSAGCEQKK